MTPSSPHPGVDPARLLGVLGPALEVLLGSDPLEQNLTCALELVGLGARADRAYYFRGVGPGGSIHRVSQIAEWARPGISPQIDNPDLQNLPLSDAFARWVRELSDGRPVFGLVRDFPADERDLLLVQDIRSLAVVPIFQGGAVRGFIGFDACSDDRVWTDHEIQVLRALAAGIGGAIARRASEAALTAQAEDLRRSRRAALSLMEDAQAAEKQAAAANEAKSRFLAVMSHEMRTPLNGILGYAELIAETAPAPYREHAETIRASGRLLLSLITDLLDFSKIEAGRIDLDLTTGALRESAERVIATFAPATSARGIPLHLEIDPALPPAVRTDFLRYEQILLNLVGNAVKFTAHGEVRVRIAAELPTPGDRATVLVTTSVADTGIGIAPETFERIFEPFSQAHRSVHQQYGGTGLGLAISRRLARLLGGDITVSSEPGRGSCFSLTTPMEIAESVAPTTPPPSVEPLPPGKAPLVLVADDVATNRGVAGAFLRRLGCEVAFAENGEEAIRLAQELRPRLVLMDVLMPGMDGLAATRAIREATTPPAERPWIAALSADATPENERQCLEAGMDFFLTKPLRREALARVIAEVQAAAAEKV